VPGTCESLGTDLLETLAKMSPSKEEEIRLKEYKGDISKLGPAERFLKGLLDIPFAFKRVDAMLYRASFKEEVVYIRKSFETLEVNLFGASYLHNDIPYILLCLKMIVC